MPDLLPLPEAAAFIGLSANTLRSYVAVGKIAPAARGERRALLFHPEDLEPLRGARDAYQARRRQRSAEIAAAGRRTCSKCRRDLSLDDFAKSARGAGGRHGTCNECRGQQYRVWYEANKEHKAVVRREWRQANADRVRALKAEWQKKILAEKGDSYEKQKAYYRQRYHILTAVTDGERSGICRQYGFSLVVDQGGKYRPARLDKPLQTGERAIAHFNYLEADGRARWVVNAPPLRSADPELLERLMARESRRTEEKAARNFAGKGADCVRS